VSRWSRLIEMESQIQREEAALASRPKTRPAQFGDELLPDRTLRQRDAEWQEATKYRRGLLGELKDQAKAERKELESLRR
jgi:hypothetical protein